MPAASHASTSVYINSPSNLFSGFTREGTNEEGTGKQTSAELQKNPNIVQKMTIIGTWDLRSDNSFKAE